jgi:hypothetical protein
MFLFSIIYTRFIATGFHHDSDAAHNKKPAAMAAGWLFSSNDLQVGCDQK